MTTEFDSLLPFQLNNYMFLEKIGQGSFSSVYIVESMKYKQVFCAKVSQLDASALDPESGGLCDSEIGALMTLDHPNIIRLYDYFVYCQSLILILEKCELESLQDRLNKSGPLNEVDFRNVAKSLVMALYLCHSNNIAHRDIKPSNIFFDIYNRPKLADFGLSAFVQNNHNFFDTVCGTGFYLAPEVIAAQGFHNKNNKFDVYKADVYALGVTLFQMVTGKLPNVNNLSSINSFNNSNCYITNNNANKNNNIININYEGDAIVVDDNQMIISKLPNINNPNSGSNITSVSSANDIADAGESILAARQSSVVSFNENSNSNELFGQYSGVSKFVQNLITPMLLADPEKRPSIDKVMADPFFMNRKPAVHFRSQRQKCKSNRLPTSPSRNTLSKSAAAATTQSLANVNAQSLIAYYKSRVIRQPNVVSTVGNVQC